MASAFILPIRRSHAYRRQRARQSLQAAITRLKDQAAVLQSLGCQYGVESAGAFGMLDDGDEPSLQNEVAARLCMIVPAIREQVRAAFRDGQFHHSARMLLTRDAHTMQTAAKHQFQTSIRNICPKTARRNQRGMRFTQTQFSTADKIHLLFTRAAGETCPAMPDGILAAELELFRSHLHLCIDGDLECQQATQGEHLIKLLQEPAESSDEHFSFPNEMRNGLNGSMPFLHHIESASGDALDLDSQEAASMDEFGFADITADDRPMVVAGASHAVDDGPQKVLTYICFADFDPIDDIVLGYNAERNSLKQMECDGCSSAASASQASHMRPNRPKAKCPMAAICQCIVFTVMLVKQLFYVAAKQLSCLIGSARKLVLCISLCTFHCCLPVTAIFCGSFHLLRSMRLTLYSVYTTSRVDKIIKFGKYWFAIHTSSGIASCKAALFNFGKLAYCIVFWYYFNAFLGGPYGPYCIGLLFVFALLMCIYAGCRWLAAAYTWYKGWMQQYYENTNNHYRNGHMDALYFNDDGSLFRVFGSSDAVPDIPVRSAKSRRIAQGRP